MSERSFLHVYIPYGKLDMVAESLDLPLMQTMGILHLTVWFNLPGLVTTSLEQWCQICAIGEHNWFSKEANRPNHLFIREQDK